MLNFNFGIKSVGFTLVELMVAISLIAIVTAVAIPNLRQYTKNTELDDAAAKLATVLRTAQSSAGSNIKCPSGISSTGWRVDFSIVSGTDNYYLVALCPNPPTQQPPSTQQVLANSFTSGATGGTSFQAVTDRCGANAFIIFTGRQVTFQCSGGPILNVPSMMITISGSSGSKSVVVESGGIIKIQ